MRHRSDVRTVGDFLDVIEGLDPSTPLVWEYDAPFDAGAVDHAVTVEARPAVVFIDLGICIGEDWW